MANHPTTTDDGCTCVGGLVSGRHWGACPLTPATTGQEGLRKRVADLILAAWPRWEAKSEVAQTLADMLAPFIQAEVAAAVTEALQQAEERVTAVRRSRNTTPACVGVFDDTLDAAIAAIREGIPNDEG